MGKQKPNEHNDDHIYFSINEVAKQIDVVPATIRNWEKQGLFTARRSVNGYRVFDFNDLERLRVIKQRSKDERMGMNAIRMMYGGDISSQPAERKESAVSKKLLSKKWKEYRQQHGYLLDEVAKETGISASYLSKIENCQANASLEVLQKLAAFYGESLLYYVAPVESENSLVRKDEGEKFSIGEGIIVESVTGLRDNFLSTMIYTAEQGAGSAEASIHSGEEYIYLLAGKLEFKIGENTYTLRPGDSLSFRSRDPHSWRNIGKRTARMLWIYTSGAGAAVNTGTAETQ